MNKLLISGLLLVFLSISLVTANWDKDGRYGMMDNDGNFYRYGMMGEDGAFYDAMVSNSSYYYGMMDGNGQFQRYGMMSSGMMSMFWGKYGYYGRSMLWLSLLCLILFAVGVFIFSVIFWLTYNWLVKDNPQGTKKKK
ncbi:hypothetical protein HYX12_01650 [Candidatus Woesearchaeota archaeon]|nr:hypothetical protein [Candidatus Woesearchaeota archaeon]